MFKGWTIEDAEKTYNISKWGDGFFGVNKLGNLVVCPNQKDEFAIDIFKVVEEMKEQGLSFPTVIRFHDILRSKVQILNQTFRNIIDEAEYEGRYMGVFPVKVNQMREVVEEIADAGQKYDFGLEAGSKSELLAVLSLNNNRNALTILNGYKDRDYLRLALMGNKIGRKMIIVIEKFCEVMPVIELSKDIEVLPLIGLRGKMSVPGCGHWSSSSGEKAKFGLTASEILKSVALFREHHMNDRIVLFHFHIGSQIPEIQSFRDAINEGGRVYCKLVRMGLPLQYFDVGGGLGVDYDGSKTTNNSSMNYDIQEYVSDIVYGLRKICDLEGVSHPNIVSESGRAVTAHHSCVVTNVIGKIETYTEFNTKKVTGEHVFVNNMRGLDESLIQETDLREAYSRAVQLRDEALDAFKLGVLTLEERAKIETLYYHIIQKITEMALALEQIPRELHGIENDIVPKYLCNFSVFQSAADSWALDQILPIVPIHRLNERPTKRCSIADITCDSDGKVDNFIENDGHRTTILLHDLDEREYFIGIFLTGAYQDVMGDMHNLFGRLNEVHIFSDSDDPSGFYIEEVIKGQSAAEVLSTMQYNPEYMAYIVKKAIDREVSRGKIQPRMGVKFVDLYKDCLQGYTYFKP